MNTATESVCPKGWTLPTTKQIDANRDTASFSPVLGGHYYNGTLYNEDTRGYWWGSTAYGGARRYGLYYNGSSLYTYDFYRYFGFYVRCVSEEKTVTDLTYLQDMTGEIASNILHGPSGKECYGTYNSTSQIGKGPGYVNSCIHSGTIASSGDLPTTWYNYSLASAGTIVNVDSDDTTGNTTTAIESVCPKGWALPSLTQMRSIGPNSGSTTYIVSFSPVLGGYYGNGTLNDGTTHGYWWGNETYINASRYGLNYNGRSLYTTNSNRRHNGLYIRCVQAP